MQHFAIAITILWTLCGFTWAAPQASVADSRLVEGCLSKVDRRDIGGGKCIGIVADSCIARTRTSSSSQADAEACAARELAVWSDRLQRALSKVSVSASDMRASVDQSQTSWRASLEKLCPLFKNLDPGVSEGGSDYCRLQETAMRALTLERLGNAVSEH